jgi:iron-sulfur cluster repair protein YtfE (RIC family)
MKFLQKIKQEHKEIERELIEIDTIVEDSEEAINYPNLIHVFKKLCFVWDEHEKREEGAFKIFEKEQIKLPIKMMISEHKELKIHKEKINNAINSGSEFNIKKSLYEDLKEIANKIRDHIAKEEEILYSLPLENIFSEEEKQEIDRGFGG